jgi:hypothetical protein
VIDRVTMKLEQGLDTDEPDATVKSKLSCNRHTNNNMQ